MLKVLLLDQGAVGLALALRCAQEGHEVLWWVEPKEENFADLVGNGYHKNIQKIKEWVPALNKVDLVLCTENGNERVNRKLDQVRDSVSVYAPSAKAVELEINRAAGMKFLQDHSIEVPENHSFKSLDEVEKFVRKNEGPWVIKPEGDCDNKALSFVSKNDAELIQQIDVWKKQKQNFTGSIIVQKRIDGIEMAVCGWVGAKGFVGPFSESFEHKKLMSGDAGPSTGEMGTVIKYVKDSKLGEVMLKPLEKDLAKLKAFCSCDVNCIIDKKGQAWPLEFTMRFGWPATNLLLYLHEGDPVEFMLDALSGIDSLEVSYDAGICVVLAIPDFPYGNYTKEQTVGLPIYGITEENEKNIQPQSMMMGEVLDEDLKKIQGPMTAGDYVAVVVEKDKSVKAAQKKVYKLAKEISIPNKMIRDDIGDRVVKALPELKKMGYATDWTD